MTIHTRLERDEIDRLAAQYPIGALQNFEDLSGGQANSSFKLTTSTGAYVLSICDEKTTREVEHLARVLCYLDLNKTRALVDGYLEIGNLASQEKKALQAFVIYGATATSFWRFRQYNLLLPGHENSMTYRQMNLIADQVHDMPVDDFFNTIFS